jgi:transcriptional regulator with XRE-family HTH domain
MGQTSIHRGRKAGGVKILFGRNLRAWRKSRKLLIKEAAAELGVSVSTWCQWETSRRFPTGDYLGLISEYMNVPVCHFFCDTKCADCGVETDFTKREIKVFDI